MIDKYFLEYFLSILYLFNWHSLLFLDPKELPFIVFGYDHWLSPWTIESLILAGPKSLLLYSSMSGWATWDPWRSRSALLHLHWSPGYPFHLQFLHLVAVSHFHFILHIAQLTTSTSRRSRHLLPIYMWSHCALIPRIAMADKIRYLLFEYWILPPELVDQLKLRDVLNWRLDVYLVM